MTEWLGANWGNLASVVGLALSVYAVTVSRRARQAVEEFRRSRRLLELLLKTERTIDAANSLLVSEAASISKRLKEKLWNELVHLKQAFDDTGVADIASGTLVEQAISTLGASRELKNDAVTKSFFKRLLQELVQRKSRVERMLEERL